LATADALGGHPVPRRLRAAAELERGLLWIVLAAVFGTAIGVEREFRECEAGPHTRMLVSVGAACFTLTSAYGCHDVLVQNGGGSIRTGLTRISAQIVAGTRRWRDHPPGRLAVRGPTTAATLWVVAAIARQLATEQDVRSALWRT
jgi:putative Mg2+ transporter-C (MgtC) family protein